MDRAQAAPVTASSTPETIDVALSTDFAEFYEREIRAVIGLAYVLSGSRTGADDIAQDAFVAAYRHWDRIHSFDNPGAWWTALSLPDSGCRSLFVLRMWSWFSVRSFRWSSESKRSVV